jgi:hypothetical protein
MTDATVFDGRPRIEPVLSWSAIVAGTLVALASSVFLTVLASGFGYDLAAGALASRRSLDAFTPEIGAGAIAIQVVSAALGGYLAGRLRPAWTFAHLDEAHFRDTAQGLIVWALATVIGLVLTALVVAPYAEMLSPAAAAAAPADAERAAHIAAQSAFFTAVGMLLSAFIAAVAGRIGGLQTEHMHLKGR